MLHAHLLHAHMQHAQVCTVQGGAALMQGALGASQSAAVDLDGAKSTAPRRAQAALSLAHAPKSMPCRENEHADILRFVEQAVASGGS